MVLSFHFSVLLSLLELLL